MLRELNENEMEMVSGGDAPTMGSSNPHAGFLASQGIETWGDGTSSGGGLSSGGLIPNNSGQGFDATFSGGQGMHTHTLPDGTACSHDSSAPDICHPPYDPYVYDPNNDRNSLGNRIQRFLFRVMSGNLPDEGASEPAEPGGGVRG